MARYRSAALTMALCAYMAACGGGADSSTTTQPPGPKIDPNKPAAIALVSGDGQTVRVNSAVPAPAVFRVTNGLGQALSGVLVNFAVSSGGGSLAATIASTNPDGTVTMPRWTVGANAGANSVTASVSGVAPVTVSAIGRHPLWTVMVYMAADNSLANFGAVNLLQMAQAGVNPEVQVVVQAEFSPEAFAEAGITPAAVDRPNYDTFRYVMDGSVTRPPNHVLIGPAADIGNVNMTDPAQLRGFVQWAEQTAPSEHTVLVLWNHGGDQSGLIEDETSAPGNVMSLVQLRSALTGLPSFDILYFEMCLMAGYEPLATVKDLAQTVVASEDAEYVAGWDFSRFLATLYANSAAPATTIATKLADSFDAPYAALPLSETIAAFNMSGFGAVDAAVSQLATALNNSTSVSAATLASASAGSQRYEYAWVADLVDLTDSIRSHVSDPSVVAAATTVRQAVLSPSFLLTSHYRNGTSYGQRNESRSHGLTIVMPSNGTDAMPSAGTASISAYAQQFPTLTWSTFLERYTSALAAQAYTYVGSNRLTVWQVWNSSVVANTWIEMLILEPNGDLYGPAFGSISPSGVFSADAHATSAYYEGWESYPYVASGAFDFLAWLVADPTNLRPLINVAYQMGSNPIQSLYSSGSYPQLSLSQSFLNDPTASMADVLAGKYSDLKPVAYWNTSPSNASMALASPSELQFGLRDAGRNAPMITPAQIATLRRLATEMRAGLIPPSTKMRLGAPAGGLSRQFTPPVLP